MKQNPLRVGLIGYGAIGQGVAHLVAEQASTKILLVGALVRHIAKPRPPESPKIVSQLSALLAERPDVIIEVAGHGGLREHGPAVLHAGIDLILVSAGALAEPDFLQELLDAGRNGGAQAKIASGALGALDALAAASLGGFTSVIYTMRRTPQSLLPAHEAASLQTARDVFRGSARQAVLRYPEFLNVAAAAALASNGFDQTEVRVIADPDIGHSRHEIRAEGAFGVLHFEIENAPIRLPAYGARLVAMSIVHVLLSRRASLLVG